nr:MAG TPA: hypothetical protein [Caudoviricetes sp.]
MWASFDNLLSQAINLQNSQKNHFFLFICWLQPISAPSLIFFTEKY